MAEVNIDGAQISPLDKTKKKSSRPNAEWLYLLYA